MQEIYKNLEFKKIAQLKKLLNKMRTQAKESTFANLIDPLIEQYKGSDFVDLEQDLTDRPDILNSFYKIFDHKTINCYLKHYPGF